MSLLYQNEKNLLIDIAEYYQKRVEYCKEQALMPRANKKIYLQQMEKELEKVRALRKAAI